MSDPVAFIAGAVLIIAAIIVTVAAAVRNMRDVGW